MRRLTASIVIGFFVVAILAFLVWPATAKKPSMELKNEPLPRSQDTMPGPALSPAEAIRKMTVPPGFSVELVASEPDIVNPVAMTFDERGRIWLTESLEYPRHSAGTGRDRIKVLEDTQGNGHYDKITVFADGLNIPSGIAVGQGGVWVANSPDILFLQDTQGTGKADRREVVVSGFGRYDTHELPNSLTWGPDGYLYGLNGVFNEAHIQQGGKNFQFSCAMYRINPATREFQVFCEGTSNPWGIAWDSQGSAFVSACVIDHLWHLAETGYYHRQGGPYPPYTWELPSIVNHHHQKAAYCGINYFDSDAYPPEFRERLYMGNIHGGCINSDVLERDGSTYVAKAAPDFLTANDPWFMPVSQKVGPDGCLYILDWYDRYHCYQDATRDPQGVDRERGRLYRIRYKNTPHAGRFDLGKESDDQLIRRLSSPNIYFRENAQRLLGERNTSETRPKLEQLALDDNASHKARMHALWALIATGSLDVDFHHKLLAHPDPGIRAWAVRAAGNYRKVDPVLRTKIAELAQDTSPDVLLQVAIAARKIEGLDVVPILVKTLAACGEDKLIPAIVWQNLYPLLEVHGEEFLSLVGKPTVQGTAGVGKIMPKVIDYILGNRKVNPTLFVLIFRKVVENRKTNPTGARQCLNALVDKIETGEVTGTQLATFREQLLPIVQPLLNELPDNLLTLDAAMLATTFKVPAAFAIVRQSLASSVQPDFNRVKALDALIAGEDPKVLGLAAAAIADHRNSIQFRGQLLASLGRLEDPEVAETVLANYPKLETELQLKAIDLLTQRASWSKQLLRAIVQKNISSEGLNINQVRKLLAEKDPTIVLQVKSIWGTLREERNPEREEVVARMRSFLKQNKGDPTKGAQVFTNLCAQCHKIYGQGQDVGPDLTSNGRGDFDSLLSNVFDPSLIIGAGYQATTIVTTRGLVINGILVEDNPDRVVLKCQGGKLETIPRRNIDEIAISKVSLMPEGIEKLLKPQEVADLFAFLILDKLPADPGARKIPGAP